VRSKAVHILFTFALFCAAPLIAQDSCAERGARPDSEADAIITLQRLEARSCLGGSACATALCQQYSSWQTQVDAQRAVELLTAVRNSAAAFPPSTDITRLVERIDAWINVVGRDATAFSAPAQWKYDNGGLFRDISTQIDIDADISARCPKGSDACHAAFAEAVEILTDATLVRRVNGTLLTPHREALVMYVSALDERWARYFQRSPAQWPWELAINSAIYRKHERRGYNEPPPSQLIVLHPATAYEYASDARDKFKSALALDVIGYFTKNVGASLGAVWADRSDAHKLGYGVVLHWRDSVSIGVMQHPNADGTSIVVSPNIERFVATNLKKVRDALTRVH
jgi:hypothetical protein